MIYSSLKWVSSTGLFEELLSLVTKDLKEKIQTMKGLPTSSEFEDYVLNSLTQNSIWTEFEGTISKTWKHSFPDIIANQFYGVEVKMTEKDQWNSTWNSIFEWLRPEKVQRIYFMFWKFWWTRDVRSRLYQECLTDISITHSPRYKINMNLEVGQSIFDAMRMGYDEFRNSDDQIKTLRQYYRSKLRPGEELWWLESDSEEKNSNIVVGQFRNLTIQQKKNIEIELIVLFPQILGNWIGKYEHPSSYLVVTHGIVYPNIRDSFSAGGRMNIKYKGGIYNVSRVTGQLSENIDLIKSFIGNTSTEKLTTYWWKRINEDKYITWAKLIVQECKGWDKIFLEKFLSN